MNRRPPGGRGVRQGEDAALNRAESTAARAALVTDEDGWVVSTAGEIANCSRSLTGVLLGANVTRFHYVPARAATAVVSEARISVAAAVAGGVVEAALYLWSDRTFTRLPGTTALFSAAATGRQRTTLAQPVTITPNMRLFLGVKSSSATIAVEGFVCLTAGNQRVIKSYTASHTGRLQSRYLFSGVEVANVDCPEVAYLSKTAAIVL